MITRRLIYYSLPLILIYFSGCRSACEIKKRSEGFYGERLRICIRIDKSEIPARYKNDSHNYMIMLGEMRAAKLLESYIITSSDDMDKNSIWAGKIPDVVKQANMVCENCNDDYCEAFIDYDVSALKDIIAK